MADLNLSLQYPKANPNFSDEDNDDDDEDEDDENDDWIEFKYVFLRFLISVYRVSYNNLRGFIIFAGMEPMKRTAWKFTQQQQSIMRKNF